MEYRRETHEKNDYRVIDPVGWPRREKFDYYRTFEQPQVNLTVELDAGTLHRTAKAADRSFFLLTLYAVLRAVNAVPQLRQRLLPDGRLVEFRRLAVLTTIMGANGEFTMAPAEYADTLGDFLAGAVPAVAAARRGCFDTSIRGRNDYCCASCLPWIHFQSVTPAALRRDQTMPILTWGRFDAAFRLPVALQANHALADGIHFSRFFRTLENFFREPERLETPPDDGEPADPLQ